jgi:hypothetical protein
LFDAVTFWDVLEHLEEPARALQQARARLRPGGVVAVTMPNVAGAMSRCSGARWAYYDFSRYGHLHHLAPRHIRTLFRRTGFKVVYQETRGSVDLRSIPQLYGSSAPGESTAWVLDKLSGVLAKIAVPLGFGNVLLMIGITAPGASHARSRF